MVSKKEELVEKIKDIGDLKYILNKYKEEV